MVAAPTTSDTTRAEVNSAVVHQRHKEQTTTAWTNRTGVWAVGGVVCVLLGTSAVDVGGPRGVALRAQGDNWTTDAARKLGVRLVETRNPRGPAAYPVEPGDVLFFTNTGTSMGAQNPKNAVVVINAKTKKPVAMSDLEPEWSRRSER